MQEIINNAIISIDNAGLRGDAYGLLNTVALWIAMIFGFLHGIKLKVRIIPILVSAAALYFLTGPLMSVILFIENGFAPTGKQNGVVVFPVIPLLAFLIAKVLRRSWKELWDVMMVIPLARFAGARIACTAVGCCHGYSCSWGIYSPIAGDTVFPIQLLESLVSIVILVLALYREKKNGWVPDGRNVPFILIVYGIARFFLEFFHDDEKVFWGIASMQIHCLIMILVGIIALKIIQKSEVKELQKAIAEVL